MLQIVTIVANEVKTKLAHKFTTMASAQTKRKSDQINANEEPAVKVFKTEANIRSLKKGDIIAKYEELKSKYELVYAENERLKKENESNKDAMNILEDKAEQLQNRVQVLLNDKESPNDLTTTHTENDDEPICTHCGYPAQDLCDLGAHIYEWHAEANWNEVFECSICDMRYPCKKELMSHRKKKHIEIVPICRNYIKGTCHFENCWYKHERNEMETLNFKC